MFRGRRQWRGRLSLLNCQYQPILDNDRRTDAHDSSVVCVSACSQCGPRGDKVMGTSLTVDSRAVEQHVHREVVAKESKRLTHWFHPTDVQNELHDQLVKFSHDVKATRCVSIGKLGAQLVTNVHYRKWYADDKVQCIRENCFALEREYCLHCAKREGYRKEEKPLRDEKPSLQSHVVGSSLGMLRFDIPGSMVPCSVFE